MSTFELEKNGMDFRIGNAKAGNEIYVIEYDDEFGGEIEVNVNYTSLCEIVSLECYNMGDLKEVEFQEPNKNEIRKIPYVIHLVGDDIDRVQYVGNFNILFDKTKMGVFFGNPRRIKSFAESDRISYYYDGDLKPVSIIVKDLTPEEYLTLKRHVITDRRSIEEPSNIHTM